MRISHFCFYFAFVCNIFLPNCNGDNIVIIADVHGDLNRFKYILRDAGILDNHNKWCAPPNTTVVQLGDQIDPKQIDAHDISGKHHFKMIYYTNYLQQQADIANSSFISMIGNHEHMNIEKIRNKSNLIDIVANRPIIHKIGNYIFCHGSLKMVHQELMNENGLKLDDVNNLWKRYVLNEPLSDKDKSLIDVLIVGNNSIIYTKSADTKDDVSKVLDTHNVDYMIVGHLVTKYIHLKNRIWYLDQLLKKAFDEYIYSYIVIEDGDIQIKSLKTYMINEFFISTFF